MAVQTKNNLFTGHSNQSSIADALQDAIHQALADQPGADRMVEFEVVKIHGRAGGIAGFRDICVEISVGADKSKDKEKDKDKDKDKDKYTTLAIGEEVGGQPHHPLPDATTLAIGEEGGDDPRYTTMAIGEEGGAA